MKPHEFWAVDLTPLETSLWVSEASKDRIYVAWNFAALNRAGKTKNFPRSPEELFPKKFVDRKSSADQMFAALETFVENQKKT